jgi:hypothetical protein
MALSREFQPSNVRPQSCFPVQNSNGRKVILDTSVLTSPPTGLKIPRLRHAFPWLARHGLNDHATPWLNTLHRPEPLIKARIMGFRVPRTVVLTPMGCRRLPARCALIPAELLGLGRSPRQGCREFHFTVWPASLLCRRQRCLTPCGIMAPRSVRGRAAAGQ